MAEQCTTLTFPEATSRIPCTQFIDRYTLQKPQYPATLPADFLFQGEQGIFSDLRSFKKLSTTNSWRVETGTVSRRQITQRVNRTKRPLNSWMGFRTFYSALFPTLKQKDTSPHLTLLWDKDPFKAKWTIVARAYTHIRDFFGPTMPIRLSQFLNVVAPRIGIISTNEYLATMCWTSYMKDNGALLLTQEIRPDLSNFPQELMSTHMTEMDVVRYCGTVGYIPLDCANHIVHDRSKQGSLAQQGLLASAPTVQPSSVKVRRTAKRSKRAAATANFFGISESPASPALPEFTEEAYRAHWTGSMACLDIANLLEADVHGLSHVNCLDTTYTGEAQSHGFVDSIAGVDLVDWNSFVPTEDYQEAILNIC